jgi:putative endonuclease
VSDRSSRDDRTALGRKAELAVADYLVTHGFRILARNLRIGAFEIDVVARRGPLVVAVEVRTRGPRSFERPLQSIGRAKQRRLLAAADRLWRDHLAATPDVERLRIDVAAVTFADGRTLVEYVESAVTG